MKADEIRKLYNEDGTLSKPNRDKFILNNMGIVYNIAHKYARSSKYEFDDLVSLAIEGIIKAVDRYDINKGYKFSTYAYVIINNVILYHFRNDKNSIKYTSLNKDIDDNENLELINIVPDKTVDIESYIEIKEIVNNITNSDRDIKILKLYMSGYDQCEISQDIGISQAQVSRILSKFKNELLGG